MKAAEIVQMVVPSGKAVVWIVSAGAAMFMAGVGFTLGTSEYADLPLEVDSLFVVQTQHTRTLQALQGDVEQTSSDLERIRCLASLSATGQTVDPLQIDNICP